MNDDKIQNKQPITKYTKLVDLISKIIVPIITASIAAIAVCLSTTKIINSINNSNNNKQTQVVIEPRDGDIIVKDGDDYKLLQLINYSDITFPTKVQEKQYNYNDPNQNERVDINNTLEEDWLNRDPFDYIINSFSINPNKVINLLDNISEITVYCDFYTEQNITTFVNLGNKSFSFKMRENISDTNFEVTRTNESSKYSYVTKETNDGIEWVKIRIEIKYIIGNREIIDTITSDWIATDADIV